MKILIVQLTDLHIENENTIDVNRFTRFIENLRYTIRDNGIDKMMLAVTGDISSSCKPKQFEIFNNYIDEIKKRFSNYLLENCIFVVPGNHDIEFSNRIKSRQEILSQKNNNIDELRDEYSKRMKCFYDFAKKYGCFINDLELDKKIIKFDNFQININLINSAFFSTYKDPISDNDRGLHFIDKSRIKELVRDNSNFVITLTHFSPEWYHESVVHEFIKTISFGTDILLYGHEHFNLDSDYSYDSNMFTTKICGGPFSPGEQSLFNSIIVDTDLYKYKTIKYSWSQERGDYEMVENEERLIKKCFHLNNNYYEELIKDELMASVADFRNFFVFPELSVDSSTEEDNISNFDSFEKCTKNKKICIIDGDDSSGKSTLCKYLFIELAKNRIPVFFDLKKSNERKINKIVKNTFNEEYDLNTYNFNNFIKENIDNRYAIVDDADKVEKEQYEILIDELKKYFGHIIIINGLKSEYDFIDLTKKHLSEKEETIKLSISKFYNEERKELIKNICCILEPNASSNKIDEICQNINKTIVNQIKLFNLNPSFIILFVKTIINNGIEPGGKNVFNDVFSSNIINMLRENKNIDIKETIPLLQRIAYFIHVNKEYPLKQSSYIKVIDKYNDEGDGFRDYINPTKLLDELVKCRILKYTGNRGDICFINNSFLAYFIAKEWLKNNDIPVLERMINNICYGINGDILLNICFIYENSQEFVLKTILNKAEEFYCDIDELDFLKENIRFILKDNRDIKLNIPSEIDKENAQKNIKEQEKQLTSNSKLNVINIYDYNEDDILELSMKITKGLKFIELISKTLPDFIFRMNKEQINHYVNSIYQFPNKLLYSLLKPIDDELIKELVSDPILNSGVTEFSIEKMVSEIQDMSKGIILSVYNLVARYSVTSKTFKALTKFDYNQNLNYKMQCAMFFDELGKTEEFGGIIVDIYKNTKNKAIKNMVKKMYFKHLIFNRVSYTKEIQSHISIIFPEINKPQKFPNRKNYFIKLIRGEKKK